MLYPIISSVNLGISAMEDLHQAMNSSVSAASIEGARNAIDQATASTRELEAAMRRIEPSIEGNVEGQRRFNRELRNGSGETSSLMQKIKGAVGAYASIQTFKKVLDLSDQMTSTTARLDLMNDGLQSTEDLQNMIFQSAERSRGSYQETAAAVSKLGLTAGDAFGSSEEIIGFMEQVNKQFTIAGTEASGIDAAMLQLTQAMGSGVLRGEEYNSILEQAPNIIQSIADYMEVPKGQLKDMAAEGLITSDIVKNAVFAAADETNAKFEKMPKTFAQVWTSFKNRALNAFRPVLQRLNQIVNSEKFQKVVDSITNAFSAISNVALWILDLLVNIASVVIDNWSWLSPIIYGVVIALGAYKLALLLTTIAQKGLTVAKALAVPVYSAFKGQTMATTAAQWGLNTAMYSCPIVWIIILIVALIAILILLWDNCEDFRNFLVDSWAKQTKELGKFYNDTIVPVANGVIDIFNSITSAMREMCIAIINWSADTARGVVENFGFLTDQIKNMAGLYNQLAAAWGLKQVDIDFAFSVEGIENARNKALKYVNGLYDSVHYEHLEKIDLDKYNALVDEWAEKARNFTFSGAVSGAVNEASEELKKLFDDTRNIAGDTESIADSMELAEEDLKYLRDIAEQETVNRFTTAEITVEQTNHNTVSGRMDLDGVVNGLTEAVNEAVGMIAEGVHV